VTYLLGGPDPVGSRPDLWFRLDQQSRHILLDEFQDTSLEQWEALEPLASEILSGHLEDRSATIVADPKQSIYGWRGADPLLVRRVGAAYSLRGRTLEMSYRSSKWVLELVNRIFADLPSNPVWRDSEEERLHAGIWARDFPAHRPAKDLPGFVRILAGPREDRMGGGQRPRMMAWAADRIAELARETPDTSIGVLVRQNAAVARLIMELRDRGVDASEEGATALDDSPAVSTVLAVLRVADHPGDTLAAYQVRLSPLGALFPSTTEDMASWATAVGAQVRRALLDQGYGTTLTSWVRKMGSAGALSRRDLQRLLQLTELAFRWDPRATLRPGDFVRFSQAERMEAPSDARVRVMTVHQAKGLEFDQVILPELDGVLTRGQGRHGGVFPLRDLETGRVVRIIPRLPKVLHPLIPDLDEAAKQDRGAEIRDALGVLYVALTRARHALHLFLAEDPEPGRLPRTYAGLIRGSLELDGKPFRSGDTLLERGDPAWIRDPRMKTAEPEPAGPPPASEGSEPLIPRPRFPAAPIRRRNLHHRAPSALAGTGEVDLSTLLSLERESVRLRGTVVHCWLQTLQWMEEWAPTEEYLVALAHAKAPGISPTALQESLAAFRRWLEIPEIQACLSRSSYPEGSRVATEYSFAIPLGPEFFRGQIDRVVFMPRAEAPEGAHVLDYKTDWIPEGNDEALQQKVREYSPQVRLYRTAISRTLGLEEDRIRTSLVFLAVGRVIEL
jgi:ATP-dependent exoDNAse (exonuclease V) beta subunit